MALVCTTGDRMTTSQAGRAGCPASMQGGGREQFSAELQPERGG